MHESREAFLQLQRHVYRDMVLDTLGNTLLGLGVYAWFYDAAWIHPLLETPAFIVLATATGILNLFQIPARLRRLRLWLALRQEQD